MTLRAIIFDVDGTLADTEEAHRQAFNEAFLVHGLAWRWSEAEYRRLLAITGGKERLRHYLDSLGLPEPQARWLGHVVPQIHRTKTEAFASLVETGHVPLLPGIARVLSEARGAGVRLAIASTTSPQNVFTLLARNLGPAGLDRFDAICAGDTVAHKKPAPDVYLAAVACMGLAARDCLAVEDSEAGVRAAKAAGMATLAIPTRWTRDQDFSAADRVVPSLGDPPGPFDGPGTVVRRGRDWLGLDELRAVHAAREAVRC